MVSLHAKAITFQLWVVTVFKLPRAPLPPLQRYNDRYNVTTRYNDQTGDSSAARYNASPIETLHTSQQYDDEGLKDISSL